MSCKLYIDIGDISTKFLLLPGGQNGKYKVRKGSFISCAAPHPAGFALPGFRGRLYSLGDHNSPEYLIGWPAALGETEPVGLTLQRDHVRVILNKILFDNLQRGQMVEVYFAFDFGAKARMVRDIAKEINGTLVTLTSRYWYSGRKEQKTVWVRCHILPSPLCLFDYLAGKNASMLIVDMGYTRTKMSIVHAEAGLERYLICDAGSRAYTDQIIDQLQVPGQHLNRHVIMKELEMNFPYVSANKKPVDAGPIFQHVLWGLNKEILSSISRILKSHFTQTARWVQAMALVGGGTVLSGEFIRASVAKEKFTFSKVILDQSPRYSVLSSMIQMTGKQDRRSRQDLFRTLDLQPPKIRRRAPKKAVC